MWQIQSGGNRIRSCFPTFPLLSTFDAPSLRLAPSAMGAYLEKVPINRLVISAAMVLFRQLPQPNP